MTVRDTIRVLAALSLAAPGVSGAAVPPPPPIGGGPPQTASAIGRRATYKIPAEWGSLSLGSGPDQQVQLNRLRYSIKIRLFGGKGSQYPTPGDYLDGFEARSLGRQPNRTGTLTVAGIPVLLYQRKYPVDLGDPHSVSPDSPKLAKEEFLILPSGERFFVLSYSFESALPDLRDTEKTVWRPFLKNFKLKK